MSNIRLSKSSVGQEEKDAVCRVIEAGYLGMGKEVQLFEEEITAYLETDLEVICVNTGTAALHLALLCLDIGPGDEVLVPSITYVASFQAIAATGAKPIACDVTADRVFIDLEDAKKRLTKCTKAIMPVHYASDSQSMADVYMFAKIHNLRVIEDAAHGFGCTRNDKRIGHDGDVVCFSFDGIKNITSGEGGAVVTADKELARRIKDARLLSVESDTEKRYKGERSWNFDVKHQGFRYHMSNLMAAIGREQLKKVSRFCDHRKACVTRYREGLKGAKGLLFLELDYANIASHIFVVRIVDGRRDGLMVMLRTNQIECGIHYQPNHLLDYFETAYSLPVAEKLGCELLSLPLHAELSVADQDRAIAVVLNFLSCR
jgi:dTDP-4-amino-4,6-dideoxygalactose transaminase